MTQIHFTAPELQRDGSFQEAAYEFCGNETEGRDIIRIHNPQIAQAFETAANSQRSIKVVIETNS